MQGCGVGRKARAPGWSSLLLSTSALSCFHQALLLPVGLLPGRALCSGLSGSCTSSPLLAGPPISVPPGLTLFPATVCQTETHGSQAASVPRMSRGLCPMVGASGCAGGA